MIISSITPMNDPICELLTRLPLTVAPEGAAVLLMADPNESGFTLTGDGQSITLRYGPRVCLFRGLSVLAEQTEMSFSVHEEAFCRTSAVMIDCSRNAVYRPDVLRDYVIQMALMGYNALLLYTEDTYSLDGEPYFGYQRGRYTAAELQELDAFAAGYGIELIPCIQTLAHLSTVLQWPAYAPLKDIDDILLAEDDGTYALIEKMIAACRRCFSSHRIHIGMDEAEHIGRGRYRDAHGDQSLFSIMCNHLSRVLELCDRYGFTEKMMWSDMFFKLAGTGYYENGVPDSLLSHVPAGVELVYWNYYSADPAVYDRNLTSHRQFAQNPTVFAGGAWKWSGMTPSIAHSLAASQAALDSCRRANVREVMVTLWGDDGDEASLYAAHPVLSLYAEWNYRNTTDPATLSRRFALCTGGCWDDFLLLDKPNLPDWDGNGRPPHTTAKYLLYQDPMLGQFDPYVRPGFNDYYASLVSLLEQAIERNPRYATVFRLSAALARVLALKAEVGVQLTTAYRQGDQNTLSRLAAETLPEIAQQIELLRQAEEDRWMAEANPMGFEVLDIRLNGAAGRCRSACRRIAAYLAGELPSLPELEQERLPWSDKEPARVYANSWVRISSACRLYE